MYNYRHLSSLIYTHVYSYVYRSPSEKGILLHKWCFVFRNIYYYIIYFKTALHWIGGYLNYLWRDKRRTVVTAFLVHIWLRQLSI